jgi:CRP-like cAMP-binding protein
MGHIVGEIARLDGQRRSASLRGVTDGELPILTAPVLHEEIRKAPLHAQAHGILSVQ